MANSPREQGEGPSNRNPMVRRMASLSLRQVRQRPVVNQEERPQRQVPIFDSFRCPHNCFLRYTDMEDLEDTEKQRHQALKESLRLKNLRAFNNLGYQEKMKNWQLFYDPPKKDQGTQTKFRRDLCSMCLRQQDRYYSSLNILERPSVVDPARNNGRTRDVAIECPDKTYYGSDQLTYFRFGRFVYRGWTYKTLDGRTEHVPRFPRGIPIDELRVDPPLRSPALF